MEHIFVSLLIFIPVYNIFFKFNVIYLYDILLVLV